MESATTMESVMDLSLRSPSTSPITPNNGTGGVPIIRPVPRPPWSILWYQNLWSMNRETPSIGSNNDKSATLLLSNNNNNNSFSTQQNQHHDDNLYRLSMAALGSSNSHNSADHYYPLTCRQYEYRKSSLFHPHNPKQLDVSLVEQNRARGSIIESSFVNYSNDVDVECEDDLDSENSEKVVVTTTRSTSASTSQENLARSLHDQRQNPSFLDPQNQQHASVLDIACCDGPVQFKRVSNPNFALTVEHNEVCVPTEDNATSENANVMASLITNSRAQPSLSSSPPSFQPSTANSSGKVKKFSPRSRFSSSSGENERVTTTTMMMMRSDDVGTNFSKETPTATTAAAAPLLKTYLCIYCNQSFKSLFCYQKHKKRHLNPVSVDITTTAMSTSSTNQRDGTRTGNKCKRAGAGGNTVGGGGGGGIHSSSLSSSSTSVGSGGGIGISKNTSSGGSNIGGVGLFPENTKAKTKDLNVQFFPCKKCGCKFPSYYFVHKHRKICH